MDESLLPREIPEGGVGTCRCDGSDIGVDNGDSRGVCEMGGGKGEGERKGIVVYICCRGLKIPVGAECHRALAHFPPLELNPFQDPCIRFHALTQLLLCPGLVPGDREGRWGFQSSEFVSCFRDAAQRMAALHVQHEVG